MKELLHTAGIAGRTRRLGSGYGAVAYHAGEHVLRVLRPTNTASVIAGYEREPALLALLGSRGLPVPRGTKVLRSEDGYPIATMHRYVDGAPASRAGLRGTPLQGHARERFAEQIGLFLAALHVTPVKEAHALGVPSLDAGSDIYTTLVAESMPQLGPRTQVWVEQALHCFLESGGSAQAPRVLLHGDIASAHLLAQPDGSLAGIIDWGDALIADPARDIAGVLCDFSQSFLNRVLTHYAAAGCRTSNIATNPDLDRRIRFYLALAPLYQVRYGRMLGGAAGQAQIETGRRRLASNVLRHRQNHNFS